MSAWVWYDELQLTDYRIVHDEILKYFQQWYRSIWFLWGDISIHPDVYKIISFCRELWFKIINVITNAMVFDDFDKATKLVESWVTRINISIHSHDASVEDFLTQIPWWLKRKLSAIDNFNILHKQWKLTSPLSINIVLNRQNLDRILETCVFFYRQKNIKDIRINFLWNRYFFWPSDKEKLELTYTEFMPQLKKVIYFSLKYRIRITFDTVPACIFHKIFPDNSDVLIQRFIWDGSDHIEEISNINKNWNFDWKKQKKYSLKKTDKKCLRCREYRNCQWVWNEYVEKYWFDEFEVIM